MLKLPKNFYLRDDVIQVSKELLGKVLYTRFNGKITAGIITETEAYAGVTDRASHAWNGRRTKRTEIMFCEGGMSYVYLCYGMHHLFNIVTNGIDVPHAVLIRAIRPVEGIATMEKRRGMLITKKHFSDGPATLTQALGIRTTHTGIDLTGNKIWLEDRSIRCNENEIIASPRVGVDYAGEHAKLQWRFRLIKQL